MMSDPSSSANLSFGQHNDLSHSRVTIGDIAGRDIIHHHYAAAQQPRPAIPSPVADFLGRQAERDQLSAVLRCGGSVVIRGMGGVGKTQLALQLAADGHAVFPDGHLLIELYGGSVAPRAPEDALRSALWTLRGPAESLPEDLSSLVGLYRATLAGRRILVVVDDVLDSAGVRPFLPPAPCALIVTSRAAVTLDGQIRVLDLASFSEAESRELLLALAPRLQHDVHTADLLSRCANLPLALRVMGDTLRERPDLAPDRYLARLRDETRRLGALKHADRDVYAILGVSDTLLLEQIPLLAERWRMFHVCPAPFDWAVVAALWAEDDDDRLDDDLGELLRRSLLTYDHVTGCYTLHDLLRDVARQRCDAIHAIQAGERHARFFCTAAAAVLVDYRYGGTAAIAALARFDAMRPHIDAGWRWAREHTPASDTLLVDYYFATNSYRRLRYDDTDVELYQEYQAATRIGNQYAASITMSMLGDLARFRKDFMRARTCYLESIALSQVALYPLGEAINLGKIGLLYRSMGRPEQGLPYLQQRITLCRGFATDQRGQRTLVAALIDLGGVSHQCAELAAALSAYEEAHQVAKTIGHSLGQCIAAIGLTHVLMEGGAFQDALQSASEAFALADALQAQDERAEAHELLGDIRAVLDASR